MKKKIKPKVSQQKIDTVKFIANEFVSMFEREWVAQLPTPPHSKRDLMSGWVKPEDFTDAMSVFFTGMCYKAQEEALKKLIMKIESLNSL